MIETLLTFLLSAEALKLLLTFIAGGGLFTAVKTYFDAKEVKTNSKIAKMKAPVEVDAIQVSGMETLAKNLQADNEVLREDRDYWKHNYDLVKEQVGKLSEELARQEEHNHRLRLEVDGLKAKLDRVEQDSPAAKSGRADLREFADDTYPLDDGFTADDGYTGE